MMMLQESAGDEEVKEISEPFRSDGASAVNDANKKEAKIEAHDDDDDIATEKDNKSERVRLVSVSKQSSGRGGVSDKERLKAGVMTTNKKVSRLRLETHLLSADFCPLRGVTQG